MAALIALIAGNGTLTKGSIIALAVLGASGVSLAAREHGCFKAPRPIGTPVRAIIVLAFIGILWMAIAFCVWPTPPQRGTTSVVPSDVFLWPVQDSTGGVNNIEVYLKVKLRNLGSPTALHAFGLKAKTPSGELVGQRMAILDGYEIRTDTGTVLSRIYKRNLLDEETSRPMTTGQEVYGWLKFRFGDVGLQQFWDARTVYFISFVDDEGKMTEGHLDLNKTTQSAVPAE
jgi:hypothetical protein